MFEIRKFFLLFSFVLVIQVTATAAPRKRAALLTPTPTIAPILRVENISVVHRSSGGRSTNTSISVRVANRSAGEAREVSAYVVLKNGYAVQLRGHRRIPGFGRVVFTGTAPVPAAWMVGPRVTLSCAGCRKYG